MRVKSTILRQRSWWVNKYCIAGLTQIRFSEVLTFYSIIYSQSILLMISRTGFGLARKIVAKVISNADLAARLQSIYATVDKYEVLSVHMLKTTLRAV